MKIYEVIFDDGEAHGVFNEKGDLIHTLDTYHGDKIPVLLFDKLDIDITRVHYTDLIKRSEYKSSSFTDEMPSHELICKRMKEYLNEKEDKNDKVD